MKQCQREESKMMNHIVEERMQLESFIEYLLDKIEPCYYNEVNKAARDFLSNEVLSVECLSYFYERHATNDEVKEVLKWISKGNDYKTNGSFIYDEKGKLMDYINAMRMEIEIYREMKRNKQL